MRVRRTGVSAAAIAAAALTLVVPTVATAVPAAAEPVQAKARPSAPIVVERDRPTQRLHVRADSTGEALLDLTVAAPGTDWAVEGKESAVVSVYVDRRYATDVVVTGDAPSAHQVALGQLRRGPHTLELRYADASSAAGAKSVVASDLQVETYARNDPEYSALRFAPILYGRNMAEFGDAYQNATTDTPLIAWHETGPGSKPGHVRITYSVIWSNEDGGTNTPALMARWGRTTDIEWIYAVELDANGERVAGSDTYQAPNHATLQFKGGYEGDHAKLQTCTSNNNLCDQVDDPMRFFLSTLETRPADQAREAVMDANPWTYLVMAKELIREGKIEAAAPNAPDTPEVSDQRNYLYAVVKKTTEGANTGSSWVGVALGVRLTSGETVYLSHHVDPTRSLQRDDPAATTVELPAGTTQDDIAEITARRVVVGTDSGAAVHVTGIQRGFLLGTDYLPQPSFLTWSGDMTLTADQPTAVLWRR
ncbi:hypothetical protein [Actinopolymorpha pittospori]|uniref:Uncharacterized protein n=1 Tax=Actinopolymorpha pittospori TaxID=648752 RepID=A0A927MZK5_9ACTN|nr:hypothetical protein [Actinopolymorpha pittospori]MBE1609491.1 hypothetical protein [Actinopolymorpha pittospori]